LEHHLRPDTGNIKILIPVSEPLIAFKTGGIEKVRLDIDNINDF